MSELTGERGFLFESVQSIPFRTMTESLKEVLVDAVFKFCPAGVSLVSMDNTKSIIVQLLLFSRSIERYACDDTYYVGLNLNCFFKIIKTLTTQDSLMFIYKEAEPYVLEIYINSIEKRSKNKYTIQLLDINMEEELTFEIESFNTVLQMQSYYFQKTVKDLLNTGGVKVEILTKFENSGSSIIFKSNDNMLQSELALYETTEGLRFKKKSEKSPETCTSYGVFTLKHLITFTKCTTLCPVVTLYLMQGYPLVLQYSVANLGLIRYCIASLEKESK